MNLPLNMPSDEQGIGLPPSQFNTAFPFHLAFGRDFSIVQAGPSLLRVCPDVGFGEDIRDRFSLVSPETTMDFASLSAGLGKIMIWEHKQTKLRFRGQLLAIDDTVPAIVCLWSPWLEDYADVDRHGLLPGDFAIHDPSMTLLQMLQSQRIALQDERELTEKLSEHRAGLIQANTELSRQFGLLWDELADLRQKEDEVLKIALIANNTGNAVVMTDAEGRVEWVNEAFSHLTGYSLEEMLGKTPGSILQGEKSDPDVVGYIRRQFRDGKSFGADIINYSKSGREYWVQFEVQPIKDEDDKITNWMAVERNISEQKKHELALLEAKKAAEAANQAKSAFLATMSHEIRTPMNAILGTLSLLRDSSLNEEQAVWMKSAYNAANALLNIIDDILDFSKIEAGKLTFQTENFDLKALLDDIVLIFQIRAKEKGLSLSLNIDPAVPLALHGDPFRLRQILVNLVGNAMKFTDQGGISISVYQQELMATRNVLRFHVKDSGIGIPNHARASLFNHFVQLDSGASRRYGGTGLGLAISKRLACLMGGDIGFSSLPASGSDFWFTVQLDSVSDAAIRLNPESTSVPLRQGKIPGKPSTCQDRRKRATKILVAEDGDANRLVVTAMLDKAGYQVDIALDGAKALDAARNGDYDLILMDVQMPEMDGYEATMAIRNLPDQRRARVPIVALTASALQEDRSACLAAGMNDFISKPLNKERLLATVANWLRKSDKACPAAVIPPDPDTDTNIMLLEGQTLQFLASETDAEIMKKTVSIFIDDTENRVKKIVRAAGMRDFKAIGFEAHSIKGGAMTLGALRLATTCGDIENACNNGNIEAAVHFSQRLQQVFEATRISLIKHVSD